jgi:large subunit ribosomal protein L24
MKKKYSPKWISSKQPRKQRKYRYNSPLHIKHKFLNANLSKTLRQKYGKRSFPLRKEDDVLVMRGSFKGKKAKIISVNLKRSRVTLENIQRSKKDGTKVSVFFKPSSLQIQSLFLEDKKRIAKLEKSSTKENKNGTPKKTKINN